MKQAVEGFVEIWRKYYCQVIPLILTALYVFSYDQISVYAFESENIVDALTSIMTFVSIIISFFGVLLTILISVKEQSEMITYFLRTADVKEFVSSIKKLIVYGLATVILCAVLVLYDIMSEWLIGSLSTLGIFLLFRFILLTYRFTTILLMLFVKEKVSPDKKTGRKMDNQGVSALNQKLRTKE